MVQIDMEMPECCMDCPLFYDNMMCSVTQTGADWENFDKERLSDCPLYERSEK